MPQSYGHPYPARDMASDVASAGISGLTMSDMRRQGMTFVQSNFQKSQIQALSQYSYQSKILTADSDFMELYTGRDCCISHVSIYSLVPEIVFNNPNKDKFMVYSNSFINRELQQLSAFHAGRMIGFVNRQRTGKEMKCSQFFIKLQGEGTFAEGQIAIRKGKQVQEGPDKGNPKDSRGWPPQQGQAA